MYVRKYYQIYADFRVPIRDGRVLASILNALAPLEEVQVLHHQTRIVLPGDVEVKVGYDPFIQVSSPDWDRTVKTFEKIEKTLQKLVGEVKGDGV